MKPRGRKFMVVMLSLMMIASSFITFSFAEDPQEPAAKSETTEAAAESKPEPPKAKEPAPEPVKESPPAPEPVKEEKPAPEPVVEKASAPAPTPDPEPTVDNSGNDEGNGASEEPIVENDAAQLDLAVTEEVSVNDSEVSSGPEVVQNNQEEEPKEEEQKAEEDKEEEDRMPAQSFSGSAGGLSVKASVGEGVFPEGTKMKVSAVSASGVVAAAQGLVSEDSEVIDAAAADITFYHKGKEIQPKGSVRINLRPTRAVDGDTYKMVHVSDGGSVNVVAGASAGGGSASVSSFSIYGIIGEEYISDTEVNARYTYEFYVGGELVDSQTAINGETITAPPSPKTEEGKFKGWKAEGGSSMLSFPISVSIPEDATEDKVIKVNAEFAELFHATFWKDLDKKEVLEIKEGEKTAEITTSDVVWKFPDGSGIIGWSLNGKSVTKFNIEEDVDLLPIISDTVYTVSFETGEGSPIPTVFVEKGKTVTKPSDPFRSGYKFIGWFTDSAHTKEYDFKSGVNSNLTLYAKWEGEKTTYRVLYWKQNANNDGYTFAEMETKMDNAGLTATYNTQKEYSGFTLNAEKSGETVIIKGDGTTIKNVYYDRNTYPLTFYKVSTWFGNNYIDGTIGTWYLKYEQDTSAIWDQVSSNYADYEWYKGKDSTVSYSAAPVMEPPGGGSLNGFNGISVYGRKVQGTSYVYYLDAAYPEQDVRIREDYVGGREGWVFTSEDHIQIPGWSFSWEDKPGYEGKGNKKKYVGRLYYTRNNYGVKFIPGNGDKAIEKNAAYEAPINNLVPAKYNSTSTWNNNGIKKTFAGWYDNEALVGEPVDFSSMKMPALQAGGSLVFYGKWTAGEYSVAFDLDGGMFEDSTSIATQIVEAGKLATAPESSLMKKEGGFVFGGWIDEDGNRFSFDTRIDKNYNLKAVWNSDKTKLLTLEYDLGDGTGDISDSKKYQDGAHAVIKGQPTAPKGKYFEGWKIGANGPVLVSGRFMVNSEDAVNDVVTLTAQYADIPSYLTSVTYVLNGGNINGNTGNIVVENAVQNGNYTIISDIPVYDEHIFAGWNTQADGKGSTFSNGKTVAAGKEANVLYAMWTKEPIKIMVEIIGNSRTATYNGEEQTVEDFDYKVTKAPKNNLLRMFGAKSQDDELKNAVTVTLKNGEAKAARTDAGTTSMGLTMDNFEIKANNGYQIVGTPTYNDGSITIEPFVMTVGIKGNTLSEVYDGTEKSVSGFTAEPQREPPATFNTVNVIWIDRMVPTVSATEVGEYPMGLNPNDFMYDDNNFRITFELISDGLLEITPREIEEEEIDPPVIPEKEKEEVKGDYKDDRVKKDNKDNIEYLEIHTADKDDVVKSEVKGESSGTGGVNTADRSDILLFIKILSFAAVALLILLISRSGSEEERE